MGHRARFFARGTRLIRTVECAARLSRLCDALVVRYPDQTFAPQYGRLLARMRGTGGTIGSMDLLIAAAAILDDCPLVTRNVRHFSKVPGLQVIGY